MPPDTLLTLHSHRALHAHIRCKRKAIHLDQFKSSSGRGSVIILCVCVCVCVMMSYEENRSGRAPADVPVCVTDVKEEDRTTHIEVQQLACVGRRMRGCALQCDSHLHLATK